jgi:transposase
MAISEAQYRLIEHCLPKQRGNVSVTNLRVLNAILYIVESNCSWRRLPRSFGHWHTVYMRVRRWAQRGVLDRVFTQLQRAQILRIRIEVATVDAPLWPPPVEAARRSQQQARGASARLANRANRFLWLPREVERERCVPASNSNAGRTAMSHGSVRQRPTHSRRRRTTESESRR